MGLEFKPKLSVVLAVLNGVTVALSYIVTQGDVTVMIVWFAIVTGITAGISYYNDQEKTENGTRN